MAETGSEDLIVERRGPITTLTLNRPSVHDLDREVDKLCEVMLAKNPLTIRRTKFIMNKGADLHISGALAFEVPISPFTSDFPTRGIKEFTAREGRERRRQLSKSFWQR